MSLKKRAEIHTVLKHLGFCGRARVSCLWRAALLMFAVAFCSRRAPRAYGTDCLCSSTCCLLLPTCRIRVWGREHSAVLHRFFPCGLWSDLPAALCLRAQQGGTSATDYSLLEPLWGCMPSLRHQHSREGPLPQVILCSNPSGATHHPLSISTAGRDLYHVLFSAQTPLWPNAIPRGSALCTHRLLCHRPFPPPSVSPRVGVSAEAELCSLGPRAGAVQGGEGGAERRGAAGAACQPAAPRGRGPAKSAPPEERAQEAELRAGPPHLLGTGGGESGGSHPSVQTARVSVGLLPAKQSLG